MNADTPIVILGFGRSGTTWVADIISKALGGLIAFEAYHPAVCDFSEEVCYSRDYPVSAIQDQWQLVNQRQIKNRWLLRNHLNSPLEAIPQEFVDMVWQESDIIGFKSIRLNHLLGSLSSQWDINPLIIIRDPRAVVASIHKRPRFWEEYGWDVHKQIFSERNAELYDTSDIVSELTTTEGMIAYMWTVGNASLLRDSNDLGIAPFYYEDLYRQPYATARVLLKSLGKDQSRLHPSYLFTPSMTTLRTIHDIGTTDQAVSDLSFFWKDALSDEQLTRINAVVRCIASQDEHLSKVCADKNYLL